MKKLNKENFVDLALNMARIINATITNEMIEMIPDSCEASFKTKSFKVKMIVEENESGE